MSQKGFALPTVIMTSLALFILGFAILQTVMSIRSSALSNYYHSLAEEAAEAGAVYASACLENSQRKQTWGPTDYQGNSRPTLKQNTHCDGSSAGSVASVLVVSDSSIITEFEVGALDFTAGNATRISGVQISAKGYAKVRSGSTGVAKTYEATVKKTITWADADLSATKTSSGTNKSCGILGNNVFCWGYNTNGQLGNDSYVDSNIPVKVKKEPGVLAGKTITEIFSAQGHNCVLADGEMFCWGANHNGQLGDGTTTTRPKPVKVNGFEGKTIIAIGGTRETSCAIIDTGKAYCWGSNYYGAVGQGSQSYSNTLPLPLATGSGEYLPPSYTAAEFSTSGSRSENMCMIADGDAYCWGPDDGGQIGDGGPVSYWGYDVMWQPKKVGGLLAGKTVTSITGDGWYPESNTPRTHICAVADSKAYCWGDNYYGQVGNNSSTRYITSPVAVYASGSGVLRNKVVDDISAGLAHTCAMAEGTAYCWGWNTNGQIGDNTFSSRRQPVRVTQQPGKLQEGNVIAISAGGHRGCAINNEGKSYCWGLNGQGQIGDGTLVNRRVPTESLFLRPKNNEYIY